MYPQIALEYLDILTMIAFVTLQTACSRLVLVLLNEPDSWGFRFNLWSIRNYRSGMPTSSGHISASVALNNGLFFGFRVGWMDHHLLAFF